MDDIFVDLRAAGLDTPSSRHGREILAEQLGFSYSYLANVLSGRKPYSGKLRQTIRAMATDDPPSPISPADKTDFYPVFAPVIERAEPAANQVDPRIYKIFTDPEGRAVVTKVIARFTNHRDADEYVLFLNSQIKRGKEAG